MVLLTVRYTAVTVCTTRCNTKNCPFPRCIYIIDYCKSTVYFRQHNNICIYFNITYIVTLATCFDSYESSSGINIQELLVHIVLQFFTS